LLGGIIAVEAAAAFEELTLSNRDDELVWQADAAWPNSWRAARYESAIGYIQAQRTRRKIMQEFAETMAPVDAIIHPNFAGGMLQLGNHCGYPALHIVTATIKQPTRQGFTSFVAANKTPADATLHPVPFGLSLTGHLFDEARLVAIGRELEKQINFSGRPELG
jgi:Asp-tRNA(Asn)/Glu-tRNA(Gln) amidotransferase A subunit family amidase